MHSFDELHTLLARMKAKCNIIGIKEKNTVRNINGYAIQHTPTEANCSSALLYIGNSLNYIVRNNLAIYKKKELESIFIEVKRRQNSNVNG